MSLILSELLDKLQLDHTNFPVYLTETWLECVRSFLMRPLRGLNEDLALIGAFHGYWSNISKVIRVTKEE